MDYIRIIIDTLSNEDQKEFGLFIKRQKNTKKRKDLELFKILQTQKKLHSSEIIQCLYSDKPNIKAYHSLRIRLMRQLTDFIMLKQKEEDTSSASEIMGLVSLSKYLFNKRSNFLGWKFIKKAESIAQSNEQFDLLNNIYNIQIEYYNTEFAGDLHSIIEKRNRNKSLADEDENANIAYSMIRKELEEARIYGGDIDFSAIVEKVLNNFELQNVIRTRPRLLYNLMSITRSAVLVRKDYFSFEPYVIKAYHDMEEQHGYSRGQLYYKFSLLYMISHVLYRNKKFSLSIGYLSVILKDIEENKRSYFELFNGKCTLLKAANLSFLGKNEEAIDILENLLNTKKNSLRIQDFLNAKINLCFYYFQQKEYSKIIKELSSFSHTDKWYEKKMGVEWVLRKSLSEMILQYELGNLDLMVNKIRNIERQYKHVLGKKPFQKIPTYLGLVKELIKSPDFVSKPSFFEKVDDAFEYLPIEQENIQEVNFYAWLKSKMLKRDYYEVLLELMTAG